MCKREHDDETTRTTGDEVDTQDTGRDEGTEDQEFRRPDPLPDWINGNENFRL